MDFSILIGAETQNTRISTCPSFVDAEKEAQNHAKLSRVRCGFLAPVYMQSHSDAN
jgi:hypothetical protein